MQIHRKTSQSGNNWLFKILIKITILLFVILGLLFLVDKIEFPTPIKKIEKIIPNENFKVVK